VAGTGSAGTGSVGAAGSGSTAGGAVCDAPKTILTPICGNSGCHGADSPQGDFGVSDAAARALVDKPAQPSGISCGKFFDSANPQASAVLTMLQDNPPSGCLMTPMPLGADPLTPDQTACILSWIQQF
jgi:hypothetical protein